MSRGVDDSTDDGLREPTDPDYRLRPAIGGASGGWHVNNPSKATVVPTAPLDSETPPLEGAPQHTVLVRPRTPSDLVVAEGAAITPGKVILMVAIAAFGAFLLGRYTA